MAKDIIYVPSTSKIYFIDSSSYIRIINSSNTDLYSSLGTNFLVSGSSYLCYCPQNDRVYISTTGSNGIVIVNPQTESIISTISISDDCNQITYCPSSYVFFGTVTGESLYAIRVSDNTIISTQSLGGKITAKCYSPVNNKLYLCRETTNNILKYDPSNLVVLSTISGNDSTPCSMAFCPSNNKIYVGTRSNKINTINPLESDNVISTITFSSSIESLAYWPILDRIVASCNLTSYIIDPSNNTITKTISTSGQGYNSCYCPSNNRIYISHQDITYWFDSVQQIIGA